MADIYLCSVPPPGNAGTKDVVLVQSGFQAGMGWPAQWVSDLPPRGYYRPLLLADVPQNLLGTLLGSVSPFAAIDLPNPRGYPYPVDGRTWLQSIDLQLIGTDVIWGAPGEPAYQTDQPNPRGYLFPIDDRGFLQGTNLLLGQAPRQQIDQPNPRGYPFPVDGRTFLQTLDLELSGKDVIWGVAGEPAYLTDWPNPLIAGRLNNSLGASFGYGINVPQEPPNALYDWPNPGIARRLPEYPISPNLTAGLPEAEPFYLTDQPKPLIAGRVSPADSPPLNLQGNTLAALTPVNQTDWPNPRIAGRILEIPDTSTITTTVGVTQTPFPSLDWPNPFIARRLTYVLDINTVVFGFTPFAQLDWPNPFRPGRLADNPIILNLATAELAPIIPPVLALDWPNPRLVVSSFIWLDAAPASLPLTTLAPITPPGSGGGLVHHHMGSPGG